MAADAVGRVALMSIHPEYADAILAGRKTVEFRKRPIGEDVTHIIVYATAPAGAVVGAFTVGGQDTTSPKQLWKTFSSAAGITRSKFLRYYAGRKQGTGIRVGEVFIAEEPLALAECLGVNHPPQSYQYVPVETARGALAQMVPAARASSASGAAYDRANCSNARSGTDRSGCLAGDAQAGAGRC